MHRTNKERGGRRMKFIIIGCISYTILILALGILYELAFGYIPEDVSIQAALFTIMILFEVAE